MDATAIEYHAVLDGVGWLADHEDARVDWLPVYESGLLRPAVLSDAIERDSGVAQPSRMLLAMGADDARARGSLRFSLSQSRCQAAVDALGAVIGEIVDRARRAAR